MDFMEVIKGRRSVRLYRGDPVGDDTLESLLEAVRWAPSWANSQCWEVIVVRQEETRRRLVDALPQGNPGRQGILQAPVTLVFLGIKGKSGFWKGEACTDKGDWFMYDLGLAMENLCLAAHAVGLGTVIIGYFDAAQVAEILQVPQDKEVVAMTPVGFPERVPDPPQRKEISQFVYHEGYGRQE